MLHLHTRATLFPYTTLFRSKASVAFGDQDTKHQALAQAVTEARIQAIQGLLGVRLEHRFIDFQQENNLKGETSLDRKSTRLNSSHMSISYAVFCLKKKKLKL